MSNKKSLISDDITNMFSGMSKKSYEKASKERGLQAYKKPSSDYYRLDLIVRDTIETTKQYTRENGKVISRPIPIQSDKILKDYKSYLTKRAKEESTSITKYLHRLIDADMKKNGYK